MTSPVYFFITCIIEFLFSVPKATSIGGRVSFEVAGCDGKPSSKNFLVASHKVVSSDFDPVPNSRRHSYYNSLTAISCSASKILS